MLLNSHDIINRNLLKLENSMGKPAQIGYDLSVKNIFYHNDDTLGQILKDRTIVPEQTALKTVVLDNRVGWFVDPGYYDIMFHEGVRMPNNLTAFIKQRSSLYRNGIIINSPLFDPGFETDNMGTLMFVHKRTFIEQDARLAQIYFYENNVVDESNLYNGQWQNDKQRETQIKG